mgnify:CR=1 FL=1
MAYQNLRFFDSNSDQLNMVWNDELGFYQSNVYLPVVSEGLYETCTIFVLEEAINGLGGTEWVTPISESGNDVKIKFEFQSDYTSSPDIFLYSAKLENGEPFVNVDKYQEATFLDPSYSTGTQNGFKVVTNAAKPIPLKAQVALKSDVDSFHVRTLNVYIDSAKYAEIKVYGEIEAEDERLTTLLSNMGMSLHPFDFFIFKDMDVKEGAPDYILINQKRKELLLQAAEIKPFIGTYKALLNAIDFFGYNNLTLKEYWLNVNEQSENFGKLLAVAVPNQEVKGFLADKNRTTELPNSNHKKTSRFSLVYRLNTPTGEYDEWDIPTVEEMADFSPDEILIKLYGLKNKLQKEYLPLHAKIVDITGEGDYFSQFNQNVWSNQHSIKNQEAGREFESVKTPATRDLFIEDLRFVDYRLTGKSQDFDQLALSTDRAAVVESIKNFYTTYYDQELDTFNTIAGIPIGAPVVLEVEGLEDMWDEAQFTWMDAEDTGNHLLTWENWWHRGVYEIEWVVKGPNYDKSFRGPIEDYIQFPLVLPYVGSYHIEANLWDLYNVKSTKIKKDWIQVKNKNVEIYGLTQLATKQLSWADYRFSWNKAGSDWEWSRENLLPVGEVVGTFYLTMDRANYVNGDNYGIEYSTVRRYLDSSQPTGFNETAGPYRWAELDTQKWEDGPEVTWKMTRVGSDINSSFQIVLDQSLGHVNGTINIEQIDPVTNLMVSDSYTIDAITHPYPTDDTDIAAYNAIALELNSLDPAQHPILSRFNYNAILVDQDNDDQTGLQPLGEDVCIYILAVAKEASRSYDFSNVYFSAANEGEINQPINFTSYNPGFEDTYIFRDVVDLHKLNHVTLSYDLTNMPGVISQKWRLINNSLNIQDIYYNNQWFTHLFKQKGFYTVELELTDLNGNKNKVTKNILNII